MLNHEITSSVQRFIRLPALLAIMTLLCLSGCATMPQKNSLSNVKFSLDRVSDVTLAGIDLMKIQSPQDLDIFQIARATMALSSEKLPLNLTLHLKSENPLANMVVARIVRIGWTLVLDGRDTVSGVMNSSVHLAAGKEELIPLTLSLNMFDFFNEKSAMDMLDLALAFAGADGEIPKGVALKVRPSIDTIFGPLTYGKDILIKPNAKNPVQE
ncbi:MAG: hypothetical protein Q9M28_02860 [Mariprofundaceae bacterium]|nr:hypothetical protein [Mariprofundaceae bacterium]